MNLDTPTFGIYTSIHTWDKIALYCESLREWLLTQSIHLKYPAAGSPKHHTCMCIQAMREYFPSNSLHSNNRNIYTPSMVTGYAETALPLFPFIVLAFVLWARVCPMHKQDQKVKMNWLLILFRFSYTVYSQWVVIINTRYSEWSEKQNSKQFCSVTNIIYTSRNHCKIRTSAWLLKQNSVRTLYLSAEMFLKKTVSILLYVFAVTDTRTVVYPQVLHKHAQTSC